MSVSYKIDRNKRLVVSRASGVFSARDVVAFSQCVTSDPAFDPAFGLLADLTSVKKVDILPEEARILAAMTPFLPEARRAFVVAANQPDLKLLELFALFEATRRFFGDKSVQLFTSHAAAVRWLFGRARATHRSSKEARPPAVEPAMRNRSPRKERPGKHS
jgi:hypothetical protein